MRIMQFHSFPNINFFHSYVEGSPVKWTNLNPSKLVASIKEKEKNFDYPSLEDYLRRAGITNGYQEKPCLNPKDPECPTTAPNFNSTQELDIGAELTSGCYGFAARYMHWPEDLIVGGAHKNKSGHIKRAKALQSVVQLMGEHELFEYYFGSYKVHQAGWSQEKASLVLNAWQKQFTQVSLIFYACDCLIDFGKSGRKNRWSLYCSEGSVCSRTS